MQITFRRLDPVLHEIPYDLLFLADPSRILIEDYIHRGICYLAYEKEELIGEFVLIHTHPQTLEIVNLAVKEEYQGRGIGKQLLSEAVKVAKELEAKSLEIGTGNSSIHQLKLYQQSGFRITGIDVDFFVRNYDEEIMENGIPCKDMIRLRMDL